MKKSVGGVWLCMLCDKPNARDVDKTPAQQRHLSLRCRICDECYPIADENQRCHHCLDEPTFLSINEPTLTEEEARSRYNHAEFGLYLLQQDMDPPSQDDRPVSRRWW